MVNECYERNCKYEVCEYKTFCPKKLDDHDAKVRADAIKEIVSYLHEYDIIDCNCCTENNRCDRDCWDILAEQLKEQTMSECVREMYLNEYIEKYVEDEKAKKRMLDLYEKKENELADYHKYLNNCHERIDDLENTVMELGVVIGHDKRFIREQIR